MNKKTNKNNSHNKKKEEPLIDLNNEVIIGVKNLPNPNDLKDKKKNNSKNKINKKTKNKTKKQSKQTNFNNNKSKNTKQQKLKIRKRKIILRTIKWTTLLIILISGGIYFMLSPFFNIKSITVKENKKVKKDEIISLSGIEIEENIFKISKLKVKKNIKENAYIENVKLKRKLPNKIEIQIEERTPSFMIPFANAYILINNQGYLLETLRTPTNLPILTGIKTIEENLHIGNRLCNEDLENLENVIKIVNSANNNEIGSKITKINISNKENYILELKKEKKNVHIGNVSNLNTKMLYVKTILENNKKIEGDIFVNTDLNNKGAFFREKV